MTRAWRWRCASRRRRRCSERLGLACGEGFALMVEGLPATLWPAAARRPFRAGWARAAGWAGAGLAVTCEAEPAPGRLGSAGVRQKLLGPRAAGPRPEPATQRAHARHACNGPRAQPLPTLPLLLLLFGKSERVSPHRGARQPARRPHSAEFVFARERVRFGCDESAAWRTRVLPLALQRLHLERACRSCHRAAGKTSPHAVCWVRAHKLARLLIR